jgi:hypothetical protein
VRDAICDAFSRIYTGYTMEHAIIRHLNGSFMGKLEDCSERLYDLTILSLVDPLSDLEIRDRIRTVCLFVPSSVPLLVLISKSRGDVRNLVCQILGAAWTVHPTRHLIVSLVG